MPRTPSPHADRAHARFSMSASKRWLMCPHSVPYAEALIAAGVIPEEESNPSAERGTVAHECGEHHLRRTDLGPDDLDYLNLTTAAARARDAGLTIDDAWLERQVAAYNRAVKSLMASLMDLSDPDDPSTAPRLTVECRATLSADCWGSLDCEVHFGRDLYIVDLKTGHRIVPAEENPQLLGYAAARAKRAAWAYDRIHLWIIQPEVSDEPITWTTTTARLKQHVRDVAAAVRKAQRYDARNPDFHAGEHCLYCPAKAHCPAQAGAAAEVFNLAEPAATDGLVQQRPTPLAQRAAALPAPSAITPEQQAIILRARPAIEAWLEAVAVNALRTNRPPPGFKIVASRTRSRWRHDIDEGTLINQLQDRGVPPRLVPATITQARAVARIDDLTETPPGQPTLVEDSDPRPALPAPGEAFG